MIFNPINNKRASELVSDEIKRAIFSGSLKPGEKLPSERELSQQLNVGRAVIRESLRILEGSGLVTIKRGTSGGIFIKEPGNFNFSNYLADLFLFGRVNIDNLTEARLMIENDILELVAKKAKEANFKPLDNLIKLAFEKLKKGKKIKRENFLFHVLLAELSRNPVLIMMVKSMLPIISFFVYKLNPPPEHSRKILESHQYILKELKEGNLMGAKEKMSDHILFFLREFKELDPDGIAEFDNSVFNSEKLW